MNAKNLSILNLLGFIATLVANSLANAIPLNGFTTGQLSDFYPNLFVPAGFTFAIWGLIYLWLGFLVGYGLYSAFSKQGKADWVLRMGPWFLIQSILNGGWIFAWHFLQIELSVLIMLGILSSLIMLHLRLRIGEEKASATVKYGVHAGISIYLGWITIATVANVTALLVSMGFSGGGISPVIWTVLVLLTATVITLLMQFRKGDYFHSLVVLWAFFGIFMKRSEDAMPLTELLVALVVMAVIVLMFGAWRWSRFGLYNLKNL